MSMATFTDLETEKDLSEIRKFLWVRHSLLDRVIRARKIHHTRFFSMDMYVVISVLCIENTSRIGIMAIKNT